ncbi:MAG: hypothetical protein AAGF95_14385 [Chloroflexota bacterium]
MFRAHASLTTPPCLRQAQAPRPTAPLPQRSNVPTLPSTDSGTAPYRPNAQPLHRFP